MNISIIIKGGPYFRENILEDLVGTAKLIGQTNPSILNCEVSYDNREDFYHIIFSAQEKNFDIRFYKIFTVILNGKEWARFPHWAELDLIDAVKKEITIPE
jgi:hypothetical protein